MHPSPRAFCACLVREADYWLARTQRNVLVPVDLKGKMLGRWEVGAEWLPRAFTQSGALYTQNGDAVLVFDRSTKTWRPIAGTSAGFLLGADGDSLVFEPVIRNQDSLLNTGLNPAARGSTVSLWATGGGLTSPPSADGVIAGSGPSQLALPVSVTMGGVPAEVIYAGAAPGQVSGMLLVKARVPLNVALAVDVPVQLQVGDAVSPPGVTMAVR